MGNCVYPSVHQSWAFWLSLPIAVCGAETELTNKAAEIPLLFWFGSRRDISFTGRECQLLGKHQICRMLGEEEQEQ